ncbi:MAG: hypothetical protein ACKPKO_66030, partial [Candidatus Fonsibacter sp.]
LLATSNGQSIVLYDTKSKKILCSARDVKEYSGEMKTFTFSPDGLRLVSLHGNSNETDSRLVVWETANLTEVYRTTIPEVSDGSRTVFDERGSGTKTFLPLKSCCEGWTGCKMLSRR